MPVRRSFWFCPAYESSENAEKIGKVLWKNADPDIPILQQAKAEFANLKWIYVATV